MKILIQSGYKPATFYIFGYTPSGHTGTLTLPK